MKTSFQVTLHLKSYVPDTQPLSKWQRYSEPFFFLKINDFQLRFPYKSDFAGLCSGDEEENYPHSSQIKKEGNMKERKTGRNTESMTGRKIEKKERKEVKGSWYKGKQEGRRKDDSGKDTEKNTESITEIKTEKNRKGGRNVRRRKSEKKAEILLEWGQERRYEYTRRKKEDEKEDTMEEGKERLAKKVKEEKQKTIERKDEVNWDIPAILYPVLNCWQIVIILFRFSSGFSSGFLGGIISLIFLNNKFSQYSQSMLVRIYRVSQ